MHDVKYRPDIDGLRAVAVLSVVIHHLDYAILPGGFVGVDIFFVISGFLITFQVYQSVLAGDFSFAEFYKRRINRLLPALLLVILLTLLAGLSLLSPHDTKLLAKSALASVLGVSNVFFWQEYGNYFSSNASEAFLLHTWSLGVEEQFYIIWPACILFLTAWLRRFVFPVALSICALSVLVSAYGANNFASAAYYLIPTRFFELAMGGVLAVYCATRPLPAIVRHDAVTVLGLSLIVMSMLILDRNSAFPGFNAVLPCLGAVLLLASESCRSRRLSGLLSNRPMVFLGLISYSLYLWHWPLIASLNYLAVKRDWPLNTAILGLSIVLAWLSWKHVETPFRKSGAAMAFPTVFGVRFALPVIGIGAFYALCLHYAGFSQRYDARVVDFEAMVASKPNELRQGCHVPTALYQHMPQEKCRLGVQKSRPDGILIGDSYANHFSGMIDVVAAHDGVSIMDYTMDACPPIRDFRPEGLPAYAEKCRLRNDFAYDYIMKNRFSFVVLAANWPVDAQARLLMRKSLQQMASATGKLIVIRNNHRIPQAPACTIRTLMRGSSASCSQPQVDDDAFWGGIRQEFPDIVFINPDEVICIKGLCSPVLEGVLLYRDEGHLNDVGSRLIGRKLLARGVSFFR